MKGLVVHPWVGLLAPARTPPQIIDRLNVEATKALHQPQVSERFAAMGLRVLAQGPKEFAARLDEDTQLGARS